MLKLLGLNDSTGTYFTSDRAPEISEVTGWGQPGIWLGRGARVAGLTGGVEEGDLRHVLAGRLPTGTIAPSPRRARSAFDLIIAAPKPVSVLFAAPDPAVAGAVVEAHLVGVRAALGYVEDRCLALARTTDGDDRTPIRAQGAFVACFSHGVSRAGDPHLHSHLVVANLARGDDGRFGAIDQRSLRAHLGAADAVYQAQVRMELRQRLGVTWELGVDGTIRAREVTDAECRALSGRSEERRRTLWREAKQEASRSTLLVQWSDRLRHAPVYDEPDRVRRHQGLLDEHRYRALLHDRAATPRSVVEALANAAVGGVSSSVVADELARLDVTLGWGLGEPQLVPRNWMVPKRVLERLGPRPMSPERLSRWWDERRSLERLAERSISRGLGVGVTFGPSEGRGASLR